MATKFVMAAVLGVGLMAANAAEAGGSSKPKVPAARSVRSDILETRIITGREIAIGDAAEVARVFGNPIVLEALVDQDNPTRITCQLLFGLAEIQIGGATLDTIEAAENSVHSATVRTLTDTILVGRFRMVVTEDSCRSGAVLLRVHGLL